MLMEHDSLQIWKPHKNGRKFLPSGCTDCWIVDDESEDVHTIANEGMKDNVWTEHVVQTILSHVLYARASLKVWL